jgi:hypothetical protein
MSIEKRTSLAWRHALSLRGHAGSKGAESVRFARLRDYLIDVERVARGLPAPLC